MISQLIRKEKQKQERFLEKCETLENGECYVCLASRKIHKSSLVTLREYLKEELEFLGPQHHTLIQQKDINFLNTPLDDLLTGRIIQNVVLMTHRISRIGEDIKELNKMIEDYD